MAIKNKALFLDRDGVINKKIGYVYSTQKFIWLKNVKKAIKYAAENLGKNDILIIAGKGHEKFQIMKNKSTPFDDVKISKRYI